MPGSAGMGKTRTHHPASRGRRLDVPRSHRFEERLLARHRFLRKPAVDERRQHLPIAV